MSDDAKHATATPPTSYTLPFPMFSVLCAECDHRQELMLQVGKIADAERHRYEQQCVISEGYRLEALAERMRAEAFQRLYQAALLDTHPVPQSEPQAA